MPVTLATEGAAGGVDDQHAAGAVAEVGPAVGAPRSCRARVIDGAALPIGEQAEVADAHEAAREHVQQKAPEEFVDGERHDLRAPAIGVILPAKLDDAVGETDQPRVRDRDPVRVATEILEYLRRPTKRPFRIHDPRCGPELRERARRSGRDRRAAPCRRRRSGRPRRTRVGAPPDTWRGRRPTSAFTGKRNDARPRIQRVRSRDKAPPVTRQWTWRWCVSVWPHVWRIAVIPIVPPRCCGIAAEGEQRISGRAKEQRVDDARIALGEGIERVRQREDHVKVRNRQQLRAASLDPPGTCLGLARGTVTIAARVEREPRGAAVVTRLPTPAQEGGAARRDRAERQPLDRSRADAYGDTRRHGPARYPRG